VELLRREVATHLAWQEVFLLVALRREAIPPRARARKERAEWVRAPLEVLPGVWFLMDSKADANGVLR
jgi:hypothetical protein